MATLVLIVLWDVRKHIIPNKLLIELLTIQVVTYSVLETKQDAFEILSDVLKQLICIFIFSIFLFVFFSVGAIGAGDLKLLVVMSLGYKRPLIFILVTLVIALIQSLIQMIRRRNFYSRIKYLCNYLIDFRNSGELKSYIPREISSADKKEYSIHLSIPVLIAGTLLEGYLLMQATWGGL